MYIMSLARTTINMKPALLTRLRLYARRHNRTLSELIEEGVTQVLTKNQPKELAAMYKGLKTLKGAAGDNVNPRYRGQSIDEILYGEDGAWRGKPMEDDDR